MSIRYQVAVQGFSAFEKATFESFFRLAARRSPAYDYVADLRQADYVIADADQASAAVAVESAGKLSGALFIGARDMGVGVAQMPRPINLMNILRVLDELARKAAHPDAGGQFAAGPAAKPGPAGGETQEYPDFANSVILGSDEKVDHILVVDDSDIALRFMQSRLKRFGFKAHLARSGEEAMRMLDERQFEFVLLDVMMDGMDGYQTCKTIKRHHYPDGRRAPVVVMLTSRAGAIDKIRGTLAGCDAYLTKPLVEDELVRVIGTHDESFQRSFQSTEQGIQFNRAPR